MAAAAVRGRRVRHRRRGLPAGLPAQRRRAAARPRRRGGVAMARWRARDYYKTLGVDKKASPGRDQEGVPQARAPVPPGHEQGRRGRGALQGDLRGLRRPRRTPRSARSTTAAAPCSAAAARSAAAPAAARRGADFGSFSDILSGIFNTGGGRGGTRTRPAAERGRDLETTVTLSFEQAIDGRAGARSPSPRTRACPTCRGTGAEPGTQPDRLPGLPRPRRGVPGPGRVLDHPPVLALRRLGHRDRAAVPHLRRRGPAARGQEVPRQHPAPASRRARGSGSPARARRACAAARPATCT